MCREQEKGDIKSACFQELLQCPEQCGTDWAQMGHRGVDSMGTRCPLHPISSLSHGGFSPGRERRHGEEERQDLCFLVQKNPRAYVCTHSRCTHKHTPCPPVGIEHVGICVSEGEGGERFQREAVCNVTEGETSQLYLQQTKS